MSETEPEESRNKTYYQQRKVAGLCVACGKPAAPKHVRCNQCRWKLKKEYRDKLAVGICITCCNKPAIQGETRCVRCKDNSSKGGKAYRQRKAARGECRVCGKPSENGRYRCVSCKTKYQTKRRARIAAGMCETCNKPRDSHQTYCIACLDKRYQRYQRVKRSVLQQYGGAFCACCGECELEFLTMDHMDNGGAEHRRSEGWKAYHIYRWLTEHNFPSGFQVLCMNCNWAKRHGRPCPHTLRRSNDVAQ